MNKTQYLQAMGIDVWVNRDTVVEAPSPESQQIEAAPSWNALSQCIRDCTRCELHQTRTQTVFGVGNPHADLMLIGEAPGASEDKQGEPFVGRAGMLLNEMLAAIGLKREDIFIANILKCRPPNNRDPRPEEVAECTPFLIQQITNIQPKIIVALGRIAAHFLLNTTGSLSRLRQRSHQYENVPLIATYHPAYLLRSPGEKVKSWSDLQCIRAYLSH
jgi:uracil-DNA glycosylase